MASAGRVMEKPTLQEQALKCPRCDSSNTKFCYYNNYSLSQPRHFCKACKRYWTRGGTLRNVPVGGGYRKNKKVKKTGGGGGASSDSSSSISSFTHTPLSHQVDASSSAMSHINQLIYGLPNNPSFANFPFQRFNSRNSTGETMPIAYNPYNHQSQLSGLGLSFPSSSMTRDEHDYGTGYTHNSHIQDLLASSNSVLSNLSLLGSSNSTYGTNASVIPASFQKQKQVWNGFKESGGIARPSNNFQGLLPFENLQMGVGNGENDGTMAMNMVKMEDRKDQNANRMEWRIPSDNHIEQTGNSDSSLYWNSSNLGGWPDLANYGSSITPLI